jgi:signal transduction histidine kinase
VIEQQINFYQDQFKEKRLFASAAQVMILLLVMLIGIASWSYLIGADLNDLEQQNLTLKASQFTVNNELTVIPAELNRQLADDRITNQVNNITKQLRTRKQVMRFVENNQFGSGEGFSDYLNSLSNLHIDDVWLDEILLSDSFLKIRGSALRADLIPTYFASFREEDVFRGQRFQLFELDRKPDTDWKVDFTIATEEGEEAFGEE